MKQYISGDWKFFLDPKNEGINKKIFQVKDIKNNYSSLNTVKVPSSWNSNPKLERYEGHCWYFKAFEIPEFDINNYDLFLTFNGVNYSSKIWLNSKLISVHEGGFLPFKIKIAPDIINFNDINYLAVRVDNIRKKDGIPGLLFDWYNWGGIIRDVYYEILPKNRFDYIFITSKIGDGKATLNCKYKITKSSDIYYQLKFHDEIIQTGNINITTPNGCFKIILNSPELWSPETPNLYSLDFSIKNNANYKYSLRFGVREIKTKGSYLYLNNKRIKLFGINLHEELVPYGRSIPTDLRRRDLLSIKNLGFNALRTAHYPHDEILLDLTDEIGLLVLEEIPVYWNIAFKNPKTFKLAANMIHDLIFRDFNHPSVILWSVGNEIPIVLPHCNKFILNLVQYAKKLDPSRLVTYVSFYVLSDSYRRKTDIATLNEYFGWYLLSEKNLNFILELTRFMSLCHNKPWFITEFGAGAKKGFHSKALEKFSEEKQASLIGHSIKIFNSKDWIAGWFIWIYRDFKSPLRDNKFQQYFNRKGIVSEKNEPKLIYKLLPKIISKKKDSRNYIIISKLMIPFRFFFNYLVSFQNIIHFILKKKIDKFYSKIC